MNDGRQKKKRYPLDDARKKLISENMDLPKIVAWNVSREHTLPRCFGVDDLQQIGALELVECATRYENDGRAKFRTYASRCLEGKMVGAIWDTLFGNSHSTEFLNYDDFDNAEGRFIDQIADGSKEEFLSRFDQFMALKVINDLNRSEKRKTNENNKAKATGIVWRESSHKKYPGRYGGWVAYINVLDKKNFVIGKFATLEEAKAARAHFIEELREHCAAVLGMEKVST